MLCAALAAFLAITLALAAGPVESTEARGTGCGAKTGGAAGKRTDRSRPRAIRRAVTCLINAKRSARSLRKNKSLQRAAQRHSERMYKQGCFSHQCPGEGSTSQRIRKSGYMRGASSYRIGEVIALNRDRASPRDVVRQWMRSGSHRGQIMHPGFKHLGVGVVARRGKAFYTVTLGAKSG